LTVFLCKHTIQNNSEDSMGLEPLYHPSVTPVGFTVTTQREIRGATEIKCAQLNLELQAACNLPHRTENVATIVSISCSLREGNKFTDNTAEMKVFNFVHQYCRPTTRLLA